MVQMHLDGVRRNFYASIAYTYTATLIDETERRIFNVMLNRQEALSLVAAQSHLPLPRPCTIFTMAESFKSFGIVLEAARIEDLRFMPFFYFTAVACLRNGDVSKEMAVRPGDAIALALLLDGPLHVSDRLFEKVGVVLPDGKTPEQYLAEHLLKQEGIVLPEGKELRLGYSKVPARDALLKEFKAALLGKPDLFPEQHLEQAKQEYLSFILKS